MSRPELRAELDAALYALREIRKLVSEGGRDGFDASEDRRRAIAWCWVAAGSALKHYAQTSGTPQGQPPLAPPIRFRDRLAHQRLDKLDADLLWETSVRETPDLLRIIEQLRDQLAAE
ncbi:MAG TPA: HepT-like ribonuclease domain-containing protein [Acidimicrobiales bacterium]|nr:HepT-like ribonuclease domain-containing protein [Acidimicrobiales bacterium]